jgi:hypothetical protein
MNKDFSLPLLFSKTMKNKICLIACAVLLVVSCRTKMKYSINQHPPSNDTFSLIKTGELVLDLDSVTTPDVISLNYLDEGSQKSLSFYNTFTSDIYIYDGETGKYKNKIHLEKSGPNSVGKLTGFYVHTQDSIFALDPWHGKISLLNHNGIKTDSFSVPRFVHKKVSAPYPSLLTENPMLYHDGKLLITGSSLGESDDEGVVQKPIGIYYKWHADTPTYFMPFPEIYRDANWAGSSFRMVYTCFNEKNHMVFSFPADHNIYEVVSPDSAIITHYAGSKHIDTITSFSQPGEIKNRNVVNKYFSTTSSYSTLIYDKYRKCYYRIADLAIKSYAQGFKERSVKPFTIIMLDSNFNIVGETPIPHLSHSRISFLVTEKGLLLRKYDKDDEHLTFSIFSPVKKNQ